ARRRQAVLELELAIEAREIVVVRDLTALDARMPRQEPAQLEAVQRTDEPIHPALHVERRRGAGSVVRRQQALLQRRELRGPIETTGHGDARAVLPLAAEPAVGEHGRIDDVDAAEAAR